MRKPGFWPMAVGAGALLLAAWTAEAKTVGIWMDRKSGNVTGATNSLAKAGWSVVLIRGGLEKPETYASLDVLYLPGGWGIYFFPNDKARRQIVRFAASGKGVLAGGFRSGYVRTANRPMFPEIGMAHNRVNGPWISATGDAPFAKAFGGKTLSFGGHDHLVLKGGEWGRPFAMSAEDPCGFYGDYRLGRVIAFGGGFFYTLDDITHDDMERILIAMVEWLAAAPKPTPEAAAKAADEAERTLIRRELLWDWTGEDRGPDRQPGFVPAERDRVTSAPDALRFKLAHFAKFLSPADAAKCRAAAAAVKAMTDATRSLAAQIRDDAERRLAAMDLAALGSGKVPLDRKAIAEQLKATVSAEKVAEAKGLLDEMRPKVSAAKAAALAKEREEDLKAVPALVAALGEKCPRKRLEAATELGRIEPPSASGAAAALVRCLADEDEQVRTQAAISLGWMRAEEAVDALVSRLKSDCRWDRRRALQTLGAIGAPRAAEAIRPFLNSEDSIERQLAALALGWLRDRASVGALLDIAEDDKADRPLRQAAVVALGDIGDAAALPRLEALEKRMKDAPVGRRRKAIVNPWSGSHARGIKQTCARARERIAAGGRAVLGVTQPPELRSRAAFYAVTRRNNALAGRPETVMGAFAGADGQKQLLAHLADAGFTGVHNAWGWPLWNPKEFTETVKEADELGLIWIDTCPGWAGKMPYADAEEVLEHFGDVPGFRGFWSEETWPDFGMDTKEFDRFLAGKYGPDYRKTCGLRPDEDPLVLTNRTWWGPSESNEKRPFEPPYDGFLHTEAICASAESLHDVWKETQDWLHGRRKGFAFTYVISTADPYKHVGGVRSLAIPDAVGPESYSCFGRGNAFLLQKFRDGEARPAMAEYYNWYCPSNEHALRGFWQNAIHGKCFYNFALHQIFGQPSWYYRWSWEPGRWEKAQEVFRRVRAHEDLYAVSPSAANVAVMGSERSSVAFKEQVYYQVSTLVRTDQNLLAVWTALQESQIPADVVFAETATARKLAKYDVIYLTDAKLLTDAEGAVLRDWVKAGGTLIAEGTTSLFHETKLKPLANYRLADLFGADFREAVWPKPEENDTVATRHASPVSSYPVHTGFDDIVHFEDYVHRDVKPVRSILRGKTAIALPGLAAGAALEYDGGLGYDRVVPTTAKVVATYANGDPAVLENAVGKGRCYFQTSAYPMFGFVTSRWEMMPSKHDFWPNVRELLAGLVQSGLAQKGAALPVEVTGVPTSVEVTVDAQENRLVVHLLDYDIPTKTVAGARLAVPGTRPIRRVYRPDDPSPLAVKNRAVALPAFSVYDMVVVEFEPDK